MYFVLRQQPHQLTVLYLNDNKYKIHLKCCFTATHLKAHTGRAGPACIRIYNLNRNKDQEREIKKNHCKDTYQQNHGNSCIQSRERICVCAVESGFCLQLFTLSVTHSTCSIRTGKYGASICVTVAVAVAKSVCISNLSLVGIYILRVRNSDEVPAACCCH